MILPPARRPRRIASGMLLLAALAACSGQPPRPAGSSHPGSVPAAPDARAASPAADLGERAAVVAVRQVGVPYRYGGTSERGFDCSGLVHFSYAAVGKQLPRTTRDLWRATRPVKRDELEVGDLLFFDVEGKMGHVGLYLGDHRFVHAPASGREVAVADLDSEFYRRAFIRGGRP